MDMNLLHLNNLFWIQISTVLSIIFPAQV